MSATNYSTGESENATPASRWDWPLFFTIVLALFSLLAVAWWETRAWRSANQLAGELLSGEERRSLLLEQGLGRLDSSLFRFQLTGSASDEETLHAQMRAFSRLLLEAKVKTSAPESNLLARTDAEFQRFSAKAGAFDPVKSLRRDTPGEISREIEGALAPLRDAVAQFAEAEERAFSEHHQAMLGVIGSLRRALKISLLGLAALVIASVLLMYRGGLAPLQAKLNRVEAAREKEERLATIGTLATGVAHEIRNPLTAIKFRLFSLKKAYGSGLGENEDFRTIRNEIDRLENLVKSFLEFARPAQPRMAAVSTQEMLLDLKRLLEPEMAKRNVVCQIDAGDEIQCDADVQQLRQVLINLAQNAGDSMPNGGTITLRARRGIAALGGRKRHAVMLDVIDTGTGIDPETQGRLFDPFFSTKEGGTGLGLAIASRIVEQHGGLLQFSTRKGEGSTFTVVLPKERTNG